MENKAVEYAEWCLSDGERYAPKYVKKQAAAWLRIYRDEDDEAYFDEKAYKKICKLEQLIIHPDLQLPMLDCLVRYAWFLIRAGFGTK